MANGLQQDRRDLVVSSLRGVCEGVDMIDPTIHDPFRGVIMPLIESGSIVAWKALGAGGGGAQLCFAHLLARNMPLSASRTRVGKFWIGTSIIKGYRLLNEYCSPKSQT